MPQVSQSYVVPGGPVEAVTSQLPQGHFLLVDVLAVLGTPSQRHRLPGGDHEIVIGRVCHIQTSEGQAAPLVYYRRGYTSLAS